MRKVKKKVKKKVSRIPSHYKDLDAPVFIWYKLHTTDDLSWLLIKRKPITKKQAVVLQKSLDAMYDEYFLEFGKSKEFLSLKRKEIEIAQLNCQMVITGDRSFQTWIQVAEMELQDLKRKEVKGDLLKTKASIEKHITKFQIDMHKTSIREFFTYLKMAA